MSRLFLAFRVFFAILFSAEVGTRVAGLLAAPAAEPAPPAKPEPTAARPKPTPPKQQRSEALTLLATLQREARFVDLVQEPLDQYQDAQIGAAARDVLRDCQKVLERLFALQPLLSEGEGATIEVPAGYDPQRFRVVGNVSANPPLRGKLVHHGWTAAKCEMPVWTGSAESLLIVAAAEVEA